MAQVGLILIILPGMTLNLGSSWDPAESAGMPQHTWSKNQLRVSQMLGKHSSTELHFSPCFSFLLRYSLIITSLHAPTILNINSTLYNSNVSQPESKPNGAASHKMVLTSHVHLPCPSVISLGNATPSHKMSFLPWGSAFIIPLNMYLLNFYHPPKHIFWNSIILTLVQYTFPTSFDFICLSGPLGTFFFFCCIGSTGDGTRVLAHVIQALAH